MAFKKAYGGFHIIAVKGFDGINTFLGQPLFFSLGSL
jgi:hypothetical protein